MYGMSQEAFRALSLEARIRLPLSDVIGWKHPWSHNQVTRFPAERGSIPARLVAPFHGYIDCSSLTIYLIMSAFPEVDWTRTHYADMQVYADRLPDRPFSPIEAVENAGVGSRIDYSFTLHRPRIDGERLILLIQGWRALPPARPSGHAFIAVVIPSSESLIKIESTTRAPDGPRVSITSYAELKEEFDAGMMVAALGLG